MVAIPRKAARTIQNNAPGPPAPTAVATPTIFPVPIVALNAVHKAAKLEISPSASSSFWIIHLRAKGSLRICNRPRRMVRSRPPAIIKTIRGTPQTKLSTVTRKLLNTFHILRNSYLFVLQMRENAMEKRHEKKNIPYMFHTWDRRYTL